MGAAAAALLAETRRRPGRMLLTGLAITVATVFAAGTLLLSETLRADLMAGSVATPAGAAAVVLPEELPEQLSGADLVGRVAAVDGVAEAVGVWSLNPTVTGVGAPAIWRVASDPMTGPLSRLPGAVVRGRLPAGPDQVAVSESTAERTRIGPGATLTLAAGDGAPHTVTVTGVVPVPDGGSNTIVATADAVAGLGGYLGQVDAAAAPGADPAALPDRISAALGVPAAVKAGADQRAAELQDGSRLAGAVLVGVGVFAGLAVVAAAMVVTSTFRIVLTQRRTQMALLRCIGARRGQVLRAVLAEAVVTGVVAGVLGVGVAVGGGYGLIAVAHAAGAGNMPGLVVWWAGLAGVLAVAVLATVLAAVGPALAASRIPPVAALGAADSSDAGAPRAVRRVVLAAVPASIAVGLVRLALGAGPGSSNVALVGVAASGLATFAAFVVAGPVLVRGLVAVSGRPLAVVARAAGRLAVANAAQVPRRTAATISVLTLGVGLTSALLVGIASTRAAAEQSIAEQLPSDVLITTADAADAASLAARLAGDPRLSVRTDEGAVLVDPAPGVAEEVARGAVDDGIDGVSGVQVRYAGDARAELESTLGTAQLIGLGLVGMTTLVAVVGVGVTLTLSVTERTRETGLLRAVGLTRRGVRAMVAWEAALIGVGAAVSGAAIGAVYGGVGLNVLGIVTGPPVLPLPSLAALVAGVVAVAALAATAPAVRAGRVPPIRALQDA